MSLMPVEKESCDFDLLLRYSKILPGGGGELYFWEPESCKGNPL
jgi:hypothetical protein